MFIVNNLNWRTDQILIAGRHPGQHRGCGAGGRYCRRDRVPESRCCCPHRAEFAGGPGKPAKTVLHRVNQQTGTAPATAQAVPYQLQLPVCLIRFQSSDPDEYSKSDQPFGDRCGPRFSKCDAYHVSSGVPRGTMLTRVSISTGSHEALTLSRTRFFHQFARRQLIFCGHL